MSSSIMMDSKEEDIHREPLTTTNTSRSVQFIECLSHVLQIHPLQPGLFMFMCAD